MKYKYKNNKSQREKVLDKPSGEVTKRKRGKKQINKITNECRLQRNLENH